MGETTLPDPSPGPDPDAARPLAEIRTGRYVEFERVGKGGMGVVYLALDTDLNRRVAMKVVRPSLDPTTTLPPTPEQLDSPEAEGPVGEAFGELKARFLREATVTGAMEHPGIVPVYELGQTEGGVPYYTMRYVRGNRTLRAALVGRPSFSRRVVLLEPFLKVCDTLAYAHSQGVIHRDLKPANVALGEYGEVIVLDWGLAKVKGAPDEAAKEWQAEFQAGSGRHETVAGAIGTPGFMSPEAARGDLENMDLRTDVYSLGILLFEILAGELPFDVSNLGVYMTSLLHEDAPRADAVDPDVPQALADICAHALTRDAEYRVQSAAELAARVRFWEQSTQLEREVTQRFAQAEAALTAAEGTQGAAVIGPLDRAVSALTRAREVMPEDPRIADLEERIRTTRRRAHGERDRAARSRLLRRVALGGLVALVIGALISVALIDAQRRHAERERTRADASTLEAQAANAANKRSLAHSYAVAARRFVEERRGGPAALAAARALEIHESSGGWLAFGDALEILPPRSTPLSVGMAAQAVAFDGAGTKLAAGGAFGFVRVWSVTSGQTIHEISTSAGMTHALRFLPEGDALLWAGHDGTVRILDMEAEQVERTYVGPSDPIHDVAPTRDGQQLVGVTASGHLLRWARASGALETNHDLKQGRLEAVETDAQGGVWVRTAKDALLRVDPSGADVEVWIDKGVRQLAAWKEGRGILVLDDTGTLRELDLETGQTRQSWTVDPDGARTGAPMLAASGRSAVASHGAHTVRCRDGQTETEILGGADDAECAAVSADGALVAVADRHHRIRLWTHGRPAPTALQDGHSMSVTGVQTIGRDGRFATASLDGTVVIWKGTPPEPAPPVRVVPAGSGVRSLAVGPGGTMAYCVTSHPHPDMRFELHAVDVDSRRVAWRVPLPAVALTASLLAATESSVYTLGKNGRIAEYSTAEGAPRGMHGAGLDGGVGATMALSLSPDGTQLARAVYYPATTDYGVRLLDLASGTEVELPGRTHGLASCLAFSRDGAHVAMGTLAGITGVWALDTRAHRTWIEGREDRVFALRFSAAGDRIYTGGDGVRVYETTTGALQAHWDGHAGSVSALALSPDGATLYSTGYDGTVRVWDLEDRGPVTHRTLDAAGTLLHSVPGAGLLLVGLADGRVEIRDLATGDPQSHIRVPGLTPGGLTRGIQVLASTRSGERIAVGDSHNRVHVYDREQGAFVGEPLPIQRPIHGIAFALDGRSLYVASGMQVAPQMPAAFREAERTRPVHRFEIGGGPSPTALLGGHASRPTAVCVLDDGRVAYGVADGTIYLRHPDDASEVVPLHGHQRPITSLVTVPGADLLISTAEGESVRLWRASTHAPLDTFPGRAPVSASAKGRLLARVMAAQAHSFERAVHIRIHAPRERIAEANADAPRTRILLPGHGRGIGGLCLTPDGQHLWSLGPFEPDVKSRHLTRHDLGWWRLSPIDRARMLHEHTGLRLRGLEVQPARSSHFTPLVEGLFEK